MINWILSLPQVGTDNDKLQHIRGEEKENVEPLAAFDCISMKRLYVGLL